MLKSEMTRVFRSTRGSVSAALILAMGALDLAIHIVDDVVMYGDFDSSHLYHPVYAGFLCGSAVGKLPQILFFWLLPIYFLALYGDTVIEDAKYGYDRCLQLRTGRRDYYRAKLQLSFCLPAGIFLAELLADLTICVLLFHGGYQFGGYEDFYQSMDAWFVFGIRHPYAYYAVYMLTSSFVCGLTGVLGMCCSALTGNRRAAYILTFLLWLVQYILPFGVGGPIQPYIEGGLPRLLSGLGIYTATVLVIFAVTYRKRVTSDGLA